MAKDFTEEEMEILRKNENVISVSKRQIIYSNAFKLYFVEEYLAGKSPTMLFESAGLKKSLVGAMRIERATGRWVKSYKKGTLGISTTLHPKQLDISSNELSNEEIIKRQNAKIRLLEAEVELLKKLELRERRLILGKQKIRSADMFELIKLVIEENDFKNMVSYLCRIAGVSRSGYYNYLSTEANRLEREKRDLEARDLILKAYRYRGYVKGSRSIKIHLERKHNICFNRKKICRIMRKYAIECPIRRKKPRYKRLYWENNVSANHLNRNFKQGKPGEVLLTDISYLQYGKNKVAYLSTILDSNTNEVLSYCVNPDMRLDMVFNTLAGLNRHRFIDTKKGMIHSDQGWHYANPTYRLKVSEMGLLQSMSRRGNCWDNAPQESFFGHMKDNVKTRQCNTFDEVVLCIDDYMDYYNNDRYQLGLNKMTPVEYRNYLLAS